MRQRWSSIRSRNANLTATGAIDSNAARLIAARLIDTSNDIATVRTRIAARVARDVSCRRVYPAISSESTT